MTPTPEQQKQWEVIRPLKNYVADEQGNIICRVDPKHARLIAAAPKMYELLQQIRIHSDKLPEHLIVEIAAVLFNIDKKLKP